MACSEVRDFCEHHDYGYLIFCWIIRKDTNWPKYVQRTLFLEILESQQAKVLERAYYNICEHVIAEKLYVFKIKIMKIQSFEIFATLNLWNLKHRNIETSLRMKLWNDASWELWDFKDLKLWNFALNNSLMIRLLMVKG